MDTMNKLKLVCYNWTTCSPHKVHSILSSNEEINSIILSDRRTKLLDLLLAMDDSNTFSKFLENLTDVNVIIPKDSQFWPGYSILHLTVIMDESFKIWQEFFKKTTSEQLHQWKVWDNTEYRKKIHLCVTKGCSVTLNNADGITPIHLAFQLQKSGVVDELLSRCQENSIESVDLSFLHIACARGHEEVVKGLLNKGADVNKQTRISFKWLIKSKHLKEFNVIPAHSTALHVAAIFDEIKIVELLLDMEVDVYIQNEFGLTPIHMSNSKSIAQLLLRRTANLKESSSNHGLSHLHVAAYADSTDAINRLLREGVNVDSLCESNVPAMPYLDRYANKTPIHVAMEERSKNAVDTLVRSGANISRRTFQGWIPLRRLINEPNNYEETTVNYVIEILKQDERLNEAIDASGMTLLHVACRMYDLEWAIKLLERGADKNAQISYFDSDDSGWNGCTPVHLIVHASYEKTSAWDMEKLICFINVLRDNGVDEFKTDNQGFTSLLLAHRFACTDYHAPDHELCKENGAVFLPIADLLLDSHRDYTVNPMSDKGFSYFHYACMRNNVDVVKKFLNNGIDINHTADLVFRRKDRADFDLNRADQDATHFTPLHFAMYYHSVDVALLLIERGADVKAKNKEGETPLHVAMRVGFVDIHLLQMMLSRGADFNATAKFGSVIDYFYTFVKEKTLEKFKFVLPRAASLNTNKLGGTIGKAMRHVKLCDRELIFKAIIDSSIFKSAIEKNFNAIASLVYIKLNIHPMLDFYLYAIPRLIDIGCDIDQQDNRGKTALRRAIEVENFEGIEALLLLGASIENLDYRYTCGSNSPYGYKAINKVMNAHAWKIQFIASLDHFDSNEDDYDSDINDDDDDDDYSVGVDDNLKYRCNDELDRLSNKKIGESLTMRDFFHEWSVYPTMPIVQRKIIEEFFANPVDLRHDFPELMGLLMMSYREALDREKMYKIVVDVLPSVLHVELPYLCLENILKYFNNDELKNFIEMRNFFLQDCQDACKRQRKRKYSQVEI